MGIILDTSVAILLAALLLGGAGWFLFREPLRRLGRYLTAWAERDRRLEEERAADAAYRERAEAELHDTVDGSEEGLSITALTEGRYHPEPRDDAETGSEDGHRSNEPGEPR